MKKIVCESLGEFQEIYNLDEDWKSKLAKGMMGASMIAGSMGAMPHTAYGQNEPTKIEQTQETVQQKIEKLNKLSAESTKNNKEMTQFLDNPKFDAGDPAFDKVWKDSVMPRYKELSTRNKIILTEITKLTDEITMMKQSAKQDAVSTQTSIFGPIKSGMTKAEVTKILTTNSSFSKSDLPELADAFAVINGKKYGLQIKYNTKEKVNGITFMCYDNTSDYTKALETLKELRKLLTEKYGESIDDRTPRLDQMKSQNIDMEIASSFKKEFLTAKIFIGKSDGIFIIGGYVQNINDDDEVTSTSSNPF